MKLSFALAVPALVVLGLAGCASLACRPTTVVVSDKQERARVENRSQGMYRTTETGRLEPMSAPGVVREYWLKSAEGDWYRVTPEQWRSAQVDRPIEICR